MFVLCIGATYNWFKIRLKNKTILYLNLTWGQGKKYYGFGLIFTLIVCHFMVSDMGQNQKMTKRDTGFKNPDFWSDILFSRPQARFFINKSGNLISLCQAPAKLNKQLLVLVKSVHTKKFIFSNSFLRQSAWNSPRISDVKKDKQEQRVIKMPNFRVLGFQIFLSILL